MSLKLDGSHSSVEFSVRHMGFATVRGRFTEFDVEAAATEQGAPTSIRATIDAASIDTGNEGRDEHLRSADFFNAALHPKIIFESTEIVEQGDDYLINGELTMNGVTKPMSFTATVSDFVTDPWGNQRLAAEATGKLNRTDWDLRWNQVLEAGALLVSEEVRFTVHLQMVKQVEAVA